MVDGGFMFSDPIGGNGGVPLVDEGKLGLEEAGRNKGVELWLDGQGKWVVCYR